MSNSKDVSFYKKPDVIFSDLAYQKIMWWVNKATGEVSGLGTVEIKEGAFHVMDAFLLPQKNGAAHTDIEADDVCKMMYEKRNEPGQINFWWHSHVNMGTFWSGTDRDTMEKLASGGWFLNTVFNKRSEHRSAFVMANRSEIEIDTASAEVKIKKDGTIYVFVDDLPTRVQRYLPAEFIKSLDKEYDDNCKEAPKKRQRYNMKTHKWEDVDEEENTKTPKKKVLSYKFLGKYYFAYTHFETTEDRAQAPERLNFDEGEAQDALNEALLDVSTNDTMVDIVERMVESRLFYAPGTKKRNLIDLRGNA